MKNKFKMLDQAQRGRKINAHQTDSRATRRLGRRSQRRGTSVQDSTVNDVETVTSGRDDQDPITAPQPAVTSSVDEPRNASERDSQDFASDIVVTDVSEPTTVNAALPSSQEIADGDIMDPAPVRLWEDEDFDMMEDVPWPWEAEPDSDALARAQKVLEVILSNKDNRLARLTHKQLQELEVKAAAKLLHV